MHIKYVKSEKPAEFIRNWKLLVSKYDLYFLYPPLTIVYTSPPMSEKMLKFVEIGQQNPPKRDKNSRKEDFNEIYSEFIKGKANEQSSREGEHHLNSISRRKDEMICSAKKTKSEEES